MKPFLLIPLFAHLSTSSPIQYYNHYQPNHLYDHNHPHHVPQPSTTTTTTTNSNDGNNRRVFEALFSPYVTAASVVPKLFGDIPFWIPHAYFNLCDTVDPGDDSLWAYACSPQGPGPNSIRPYANIPQPTYPYEIVDDKGSGVLTVPLPNVNPDMDYYAAFWMQQANAMSTSGGGSSWGFWDNLPQGFYG